jgi:transcriptional regulator with XRE-family HTH domain
MNDIGKKIKKIRELKGFSQDSIAVELGLSQPSYARFEKNGDNINIKKLIQIAKILNTSVSEIIGEQTKNSNIQENNETANAYFDTIIHADKEHIESLKSEIAFLRKTLEQK